MNGAPRACIRYALLWHLILECQTCHGVLAQVANLEKWHPAQHVVTESLSGAIVTQTIVCHGPSHPKLPQPSPGKHTGVAEFVFDGAP